MTLQQFPLVLNYLTCASSPSLSRRLRGVPSGFTVIEEDQIWAVSRWITLLRPRTEVI
jgi:hypothetical protein